VSVTKKSSLRLSDEALAVAERAAAALGVTRDYFLDELLLQEGKSLPESGRPDWWTKPTSRNQEVLPLGKSA
jgi:hypothetical protein